MQFKCEEVEMDLGRLIAGDEERIENRERLYNHLAECADCRQRLRDSKEFLQLLQAKQKPPTHFWLKIEQLLKEPEPAPGAEFKQQIDTTPLVEQGKDLIKKGDYQSALKCFDEALLLNQQDVMALVNKGIALGKLRKVNEEISAYDKAIDLDPDNFLAWYNKGVALGKLDKHSEALEIFKKVLEIQPTDKEAWYNKGIALEELKDYEPALVAFKKAIELDPNYLEALLHKSNIDNILLLKLIKDNLKQTINESQGKIIEEVGFIVDEKNRQSFNEIRKKLEELGVSLNKPDETKDVK